MIEYYKKFLSDKNGKREYFQAFLSKENNQKHLVLAASFLCSNSAKGELFGLNT
jgi:hypothetical protein